MANDKGDYKPKNYDRMGDSSKTGGTPKEVIKQDKRDSVKKDNESFIDAVKRTANKPAFYHEAMKKAQEDKSKSIQQDKEKDHDPDKDK